jgi:glutathione S-transferase
MDFVWLPGCLDPVVTQLLAQRMRPQTRANSRAAVQELVTSILQDRPQRTVLLNTPWREAMKSVPKGVDSAGGASRANTRNSMTLYYFPGACALADHIALEWIGAPYQTVRMNHASIKSPEYLGLKPGGTVPLLIDGNFSLTENITVLSYLSDLNPRVHLFGDGTPRGRAEVMRWIGFLNSDVHGAFKPIFTPERFLPDPAAASAIAASARGLVRKYLDHLNARLEGRDWLTGERSAADPYLFVVLRWPIRLAIDISELSNLLRFVERMQADAGVRAALFAEESDVIQYQGHAAA